MSYKVIIDDFSEEYWSENASKFADYSIYQTWAYQDNRAEMSGCSLVRAVVTDENREVCLMCQIRVKEVKAMPLKIGYVQFGPLVRGYDNEIKPSVSAIVELRKALLDNYVNVLRFTPNLNDDDCGLKFAKMLKAAGFCYCGDIKPYRTLKVDISGGEDNVRKGLSKNFRRTLKNTERSELEIRKTSDSESFRTLRHFYDDLKIKKGFVGLDVDEFETPQQMLPEHEKMDMLLVYNQDRPMSTILCSNLGDTGIVLLAAASSEGRELGSPYLNWFSSAKLSIEYGKQHLDLGGIDPVKNPGVYKFKSKMGGDEYRNIGTFDTCKNSMIKNMWCVSHKLHSILHFKNE